MGGGLQTLLRVILGVINVVFVLVAVAVIVVGAVGLSKQEPLEALLELDDDGNLDSGNIKSQVLDIVAVVAGCVLLLLGALGIGGAVFNSKPALLTYGVLVCIVFVIQLVSVIMAAVYLEEVKDAFTGQMKKGIQKNYDGLLNTTNSFSHAVDYAQVYFDCCGVDGVEDFKDSPWYRQKDVDVQVPLTCCAVVDKDYFYDKREVELSNSECPTDDVGKDNPHTSVSCSDSINDSFHGATATAVIGISAAALVLQIVAVVLAFCIYAMSPAYRTL